MQILKISNEQMPTFPENMEKMFQVPEQGPATRGAMLQGNNFDSGWPFSQGTVKSATFRLEHMSRDVR